MSIGPLPVRVVVIALAVLVAWLVARALGARRAGQRTQSGSLLIDSVWIGLLAARVGYVVQWWPVYAAHPRTIIAIADGGFSWWVGLAAAVGFLWWRTARTQALRWSVLPAMACGMLVWAGANGVMAVLRQSAPPLPQLTLQALDGTPVQLAQFKGQPVVLNLWATWCPPCRREMPVLAQAQQAYPHVAIVLANQGEGAPTIQTYLDHEQLTLDHVLLDPGSVLSREMHARGLPTTLFFDIDGRMVDMHVGEITQARLADILRRRFGISLSY